jgi:hypothetical protein
VGVGGSDCFVPITVDFLQFSAINNPDDANPVYINFNTPNDQDLGTVYIYNDALLEEKNNDDDDDVLLEEEESIVELEESFASGHCTRTQMRQPLDEGNNFVSGGGYCHFTYTLFDGETAYTFNAAGEVFDLFGGLLSVMGGTGEFMGLTGEIQLTPYDITDEGDFEGSSDDFFTAPDVYRVHATLFLNTCLQLVL